MTIEERISKLERIADCINQSIRLQSIKQSSGKMFASLGLNNEAEKYYNEVEAHKEAELKLKNYFNTIIKDIKYE